MTLLREGMQLKSWIVGKKVGAGACSDVYEAEPAPPTFNKDKSVPMDYVIKISPLPAVKNSNKKRKKTPAERNADALYAEHLLYQTYLRDHRGLPRIPPNAYGEDQGFRFLVMERLGRTLEDVRKENGSIPSTTAARLGADILEIMQYIHSKNVVYVDVKPENFMLNRHGSERQVYCVDFGIADRYVAATGKHKEYKLGNVVGTPTYLSLNCHQGGTPSRRDDIEALLHVLIYLMRGDLPWQDAKSDQEGARMKRETSIKDELCHGLPSEWSEMVERIRSCQFEEKPDYEYFVDQFGRLGGKPGLDQPYAWRVDAEHKKAVPKKPMTKLSTSSSTKKTSKTNKETTNATTPPSSIEKASPKKRTTKENKRPNRKRDRPSSPPTNQDEEEVEFEFSMKPDPRRRRKAAGKAVAAAAAAKAAAKAASNTSDSKYNLRSRS